MHRFKFYSSVKRSVGRKDKATLLTTIDKEKHQKSFTNLYISKLRNRLQLQTYKQDYVTYSDV